MNINKLIITLTLIASPFFSMTYGQFSASNLMEVQMGNLPETSPKNMLTIYDQLDLKYRIDNFYFSGRLEQFHSSINNPYEYIRFDQFSARYRKRSLELSVGNFYETLGKGLLLRGYEIKNSVLEDRIYRSRQGFYKDILGFSGKYRYKFVSLKAVWGKPLNNLVPVGHPERRLDVIGGGEINFNIKNQTIGGIYLNHQLNNTTSHLASILFSGKISNSLSYYIELAKNISPSSTLLSFSNMEKHGIYGSLNYSSSNFGVSFELKDYHNFILGSGISDPPTLVKEQSYRLLNRSTHVAEFFDERGYQIEIFYHPTTSVFYTLNHSLAQNKFGTLTFKFFEYFAEVNISQNDWQVKTFIDYSQDEVKNERNRFTTGLYTSKYLSDSWSINLDFEAQQISRNEENFQNAFLGFGASKSTKFSAGFIYELTNDPFFTSAESKLKTFPAINLSYKINTKNNLQLFAGERRGGPACTSGICYEVLDFKGIELRYTLKL